MMPEDGVVDWMVLFMIDSKIEKYIAKIESVFDPADFVIYKLYDASNLRYLFAIKRKDASNEEALDPWYIIDKKTFKISGFAPHNEKIFFNEAIQHPIRINVRR